jgi:hypothetical protein
MQIAIKPAEIETEGYFERLSVVFADPIRLKILAELFHREMSPSGFYAAFGGGSLPRIASHFHRLKETGWLRHVREARGGGRRGGVENFYRAPRLAVFDNEAWSRLPMALRVEFSWRIFEQFAERVKAAFEANTLDARPDRHFTWTPLVLDEQGRGNVLGLVDELFGMLFEEQADAKVRMAHTGDAPLEATVGLAAFDSPRQRRNRSGLVLPPPRSGNAMNEREFTRRLSKIFKSKTNLKIVTECSLREMSPSEFAAEFADDAVSDIARRFRLLLKQGWLVRVKSETGGRRRGATETFYRAVRPAIFDTRSWAQVPPEIRRQNSWRIFEQLAEQTREAMDAGTFDARPDRHHTWTPLVLDQLGWEQVIKAVDSVFFAILQEQRSARRRLARSDEEPVIATVYLAAFESPISKPDPDGGLIAHSDCV